MKTKSTLRRSILLAAGSSLLAFSSAQAQTWDGSTDGNWNVADNWSTGVAPVAGANVTFDGTGINLATSFNATSFSLNSLTFASGQTSAVTINTTTANPVTFTGTGTKLSVQAGNHVFTGTGTGASGTNRDWVYENATHRTFTHDIATGASFEIAGRIGGNNSGAIFQKTGGGTLILSGVNSGSGSWNFSGSTGFAINGGILRLSNNAAAGNSANKYSVASGAALELAANYAVGQLTINGTGISSTGAIRSISGTRTISGGGDLILNSASSIGVDAGTLSVSKLISGSGSLTKVGAGGLTLTAANTYTGASTVSAGTLRLGANDVIPDASNVSIGAATLDADTRTDTAGTLDVTGAATINLGVGAALAFADSKLVDWTGGTLNITGTLGATSLRFGDSADDLTSGPGGQLEKISVNGSGLGTYVLDSDGYLVPGGGGPGPVDSFTISAISSPQTVGTPITGITITAKDASNVTATSFTGIVTFGGTAGITGTSANFTAGVLTGVSVTPTVAGSNLTFTVDDGAGHTGSTTIATIQTPYEIWAGSGVAFDHDSNGDGVDNGMAWILGATDPSDNAVEMLPKASAHAVHLRLTFRCLKSTKRGGMVLKIQTSSDMGVTDPWVTNEVVVPDGDATVNGVVFDTTDDGDYINVIADIPATGTELFGRLKAEMVTP
jgi:autotransporter-associated beta strand protein